MLSRTLQKWVGYNFSSSAAAGEDYLKFQRAMHSDLKKQAESAGLLLKDFCKNDYAFSAVLQNPENKKYAHIAVWDVRICKRWENNVLYRTMLNANDWIGSNNMDCAWEDVGKVVKRLLSR